MSKTKELYQLTVIIGEEVLQKLKNEMVIKIGCGNLCTSPLQDMAMLILKAWKDGEKEIQLIMKKKTKTRRKSKS